MFFGVSGTDERRPARGGFSLVEVVVTVAVMAILLMATQGVFHWAMVSQVKAREELRAARLAQAIHTRLQTINFYAVQDYDSATPPTGSWTYPVASTGTLHPPTTFFAYPEQAAMDSLQAIVQQASFNRFTIQVTHMRQNTGVPGQLLPFTDVDSNNIDDSDPGVRFQDFNGDADFRDAFYFAASSRTISEAPDTHLKQVSVAIWKNNQAVVTRQGELLSLEGFRGNAGLSSEQFLSLALERPTSDVWLYASTSVIQQNASNPNLPVVEARYPPEVEAFRADAISPVQAAGITEPAALVDFYLADRTTLLGTAVADAFGNYFSTTSVPLSSALTAALTEGSNTFSLRARKASFFSPWVDAVWFYDTRPPVASGEAPAGNVFVKTLSPYVSCLLQDVGGTPTVSDILDDTILFEINGATVPWSYNYHGEPGRLVFIDTDTLAPARLSNNAWYDVSIMAGDRAHYKIAYSASGIWRFRASLDPDTILPTLDGNSTNGTQIWARFRDDETGINVRTVRMWADVFPPGGSFTVEHNPPAMVIGGYWTPGADHVTGTVTYNGASLPTGIYTIHVHAENWNGDVLDTTFGHTVP